MPELILYVVSFCAQKTTDTIVPSNQKSVYWQHCPALIVAESLQEAIRETRKIAFYNWPTEAGWSDRSASIR